MLGSEAAAAGLRPISELTAYTWRSASQQEEGGNYYVTLRGNTPTNMVEKYSSQYEMLRLTQRPIDKLRTLHSGCPRTRIPYGAKVDPVTPRNHVLQVRLGLVVSEHRPAGSLTDF
ncbi:hypothetical protein CPLU01_01674 [Colletotrichum plurivorum]|uniref:Uncharacterized protein n=1 Tax=Colletotrichum plurivorum TaxID=2175906 RepID=A0A8H6NNT3_9PEZI|nr:hypothetical protein CPLU01_01674 [Colletotrichum plurivorum]